MTSSNLPETRSIRVKVSESTERIPLPYVTVSERIEKTGNLLDGAELKTLRKKLGLSLAEASRQIEVSARTWCRWEAGQQEIPRPALRLFLILNKLEKVK